MKRFFYLIIILCTCYACSSDDVPEVPETPINPLAESVQTYDVQLELISDTARFKGHGSVSRGWTELSMDTVYLIANYAIQPTYLPLVVTKANYTGRDNDFKGTIDFTLIFDETNKNLSVSNGNQHVQVVRNGSPYDCMLSSVPTVNATLTTQENDFVYGKTPVMQPFGDKLFRSSDFRFSYSMQTDRLWINGKRERVTYPEFVLTFLLHNDRREAHSSGTTAVTENLVSFSDLMFKMDRYTSKVCANFMIVQFDKRNEPENLSHVNFDYQTGTNMNNWKCQTYLENTPETFHLFNDIGGPKTGNAIIAITEQPFAIDECRFTLAEQEGWGLDLDILGWGALKGIGKKFGADAGHAYVFPTETKASQTCICYRFTYESGDRHIKMTLRIPITTPDNEDMQYLTANSDYCLTSVFSVVDFYNALTEAEEEQNQNRSSASRVDYDAEWGYEMDIPYQVLVRKL